MVQIQPPRPFIRRRGTPRRLFVYTVFMSWAGGRRFIIACIVGAVVIAIIAVTIIASIYKAPSCVDGVQNENEAGIDCGGPCPYLCTFQVAAPVVRFAQPISGQTGRTDVIAYIDNSNPSAAAKGINFTATLYGATHLLVANYSGTLDLAPSATVPLFIPGIFSGQQQVTQAFVTLDSSTIHFFAAQKSPVLPTVGSPSLSGTINNPRIQATISNPDTVNALTNVHVVATVFDASGNVVAASATVLPLIPASGGVTALFTWNTAFARPAARVDIIPITELP